MDKLCCLRAALLSSAKQSQMEYKKERNLTANYDMGGTIERRLFSTAKLSNYKCHLAETLRAFYCPFEVARL